MTEARPVIPGWRRLLGRAVRVLAATWLLATLAMWAGQDRLLFASAAAPLGEPFAPGVVVESLQIPVAPGLYLHGWLSRPALAPAGQPVPLVLYFGGNAEEVSPTVAWAANLDGWAILAVNYRGYGGNPGDPSETALFADAVAIHDWAKRRTDVDGERIAVIGRSLGAGVAVHVAAQRQVCSVVLLTPYDSITAVAQARFPFLPVDQILCHRFDSLAHSADVTAPTLIIVAELDSVIPPQHAEALAAGWRGPHQLVRSPQTGHADVLADAQVWAAMRRWLGRAGR